MKDNKRGEIFGKFLRTFSFYIEYNGILYNLVDKKENIIISTNTSDEMLNFIIGFNLGASNSNKKIKLLEEQNKTNVDRYEEILKNADKGNDDVKVV